MAKQKNTLREVNLEAGMPYVEQAMKRLQEETQRTRQMKCTVMKVIHGYGSSGTGGKIRTAARKELKRWKETGEIQDVITGENFSIFEESTRRAFSCCEALRQDHDLDRCNHGVTFVVL